MKKIIASLCIGLIFAMCFATYSSASTANEVREDVLRLHVIANSDSKEDQMLKLKVRDALLDSAKELFTDTYSKQESLDISLMNLSRFKEIAERVIGENGYEYPVKVSVTQSFFPTKQYENGYRLPAGYYDALKVEIGQAKGQNWWCILYPPLCFSGSIPQEDKMDDIMNDEELQFVTSDCDMDIEVKFKLAELWGQLINKLSKLSDFQ